MADYEQVHQDTVDPSCHMFNEHVKDLFLYLREMVPSAVDAAAVSNRRLSEATSLKWTTVFVQPHDYAVLPKQMSGASLRLISKLVYFSPDIEYLGNREIVLDKHDRNSR
jgi:hypothetical protein